MLAIATVPHFTSQFQHVSASIHSISSDVFLFVPEFSGHKIVTADGPATGMGGSLRGVV